MLFSSLFMNMLFPITPEIQKKNAEFSLRWLDLKQQQANVLFLQQTEEIRMIREGIYKHNPELRPTTEPEDVVLVPVQQYLNYIRDRLETGYNHLAGIDKLELLADVRIKMISAAHEFKKVMTTIDEVQTLDQFPIWIKQTCYDKILQHEAGEANKVELVTEEEDDNIEEVQIEKVPVDFDFLLKRDADLYNCFKVRFDGLYRECKQAEREPLLEILNRKVNNVQELRDNLCELQEKVAGLPWTYLYHVNDLLIVLSKL